ncbi:MAG: hypothetical protein ACE363_15085 [Alphaproteobacteria bacterium]
MKKAFVLIAFAVGLTSGAAQAEPFIFTAESGDPVVKGVPADDGQVAIVALSSTGATTFASGVTETWTSECHQFRSPTIQYDAQGFCRTTLADGSELFNVIVCNDVGDEMAAANCWGYFSGGSGRYENAQGTLTWHSSNGDVSGGGNLSVAAAAEPAPPAEQVAPVAPAEPEAPAEAEAPEEPAVMDEGPAEAAAPSVPDAPAASETPMDEAPDAGTEDQAQPEAAAEGEAPVQTEAE